MSLLHMLAEEIANRTGRFLLIWQRGADRIEMPPYAQFIDTPTASAAEGYYATVLHELIHYAAFRIMPRRCAFP